MLPIPMPPDLQLFDILRRHGVAFVAVGGHAVNAHGFRRATEDTDIVWLRSPQSETALFAALTEIDARYIGNEMDPATGIEKTYPVTLPYIRANHLMMLWTKNGFVDLFDYVPGFPSERVETVFASSIEIDGVRYPSLEDLRRMKKASGRVKDLLDLENLPE
jgi:hypothetical protein